MNLNLLVFVGILLYNYETSLVLANIDEQDLLETNDTRYTYEDISNEISKLTDEFLEEIIKANNLLTNPDDLSQQLDQQRRKRSIDDSTIPEFIRDGIKLISGIKHFEGEICAGKGLVIDFSITKFNGQDYVICLIKSASDSKYYVHYGSNSTVDKHREAVQLSGPTRVFTFTFISKKSEELVVVILNHKTKLNDISVLWLQIDTENKVKYHKGMNELGRIVAANSAVLPKKNILFLHHIDDNTLRTYRFAGKYFDMDVKFSVTSDLSAICTFSFMRTHYLVLGYKNSNSDKLGFKDVDVLSFNEVDNKYRRVQSIQSVEDVIDIKYFNLGYGTSQESFMVIVDRHFTIFYKFIKSKKEFIMFQRIKTMNVRQIIPYGDSERNFVMGLITQTNDVNFIIYNSLRFSHSNINIQLFALQNQPIHFYRWVNGKESNILMMISGPTGIRSYNFVFYHDTNMKTMWTEHLDWCTQKRKEVIGLERSTNVVKNRFSEAYLSNDPLIIQGTMSVPAYKGEVEAKDYRQLTGPHSTVVLNENYFYELTRMEKSLNDIDKIINIGHKRLSDALWINSNNIQIISGNYTFDNMKIMEHNSDYSWYHPVPFNILTKQLNGHYVHNLFADTIDIRNNDIKVFNTLHFRSIDSNRPLKLNGLVNNIYNMSDIVTSNSHRLITGKKRFHKCLLVDGKINSPRVNGELFNSESVLLTNADQIIRNPVTIMTKTLRTNILDAKMVNNVDIPLLFRNVVRKDEHIRVTMSVEFAKELKVYNLFIDASGRLNGENIDKLSDNVLWTNKPKQNLFGDFFFESNVTIAGDLYVDRINNKNIPQDLVLARNVNFIKGRKKFKNSTFIQQLNVTNTLNGLQVFNDGMPDILLKNKQQNVVGKKILQSLYIQNDSYVAGLLNGLSVQELNRQSKTRPQMQYFDRIFVDNFANFEGGFWFDKLNSLSQIQLERLLHESLSLNEQWTDVSFDSVQFDDLQLNVLDCATVNGLSLENDLLTRNTSQTLSGLFSFNDVIIESDASVQSINNFAMSNLNNIFQNYGDQFVSGTKIFVGDIFVDSLQTSSINNIPFEDIVFIDDRNSSKLITGVKYFQGNDIELDSLAVTNMDVKSINNVNIANMLFNSLRKNVPQTVPSHITFKSMQIGEKEDFRSVLVNRVDLQQLSNDAVFSNGVIGFQNVSANKIFTGQVNMGAIEFDRFFDGVTFWEMKYNWMVQNLTQKVFANFSIDNLSVENIRIHDSNLNGINLNWLDSNVVRLDRKSVIHSNIEFFGNSQVQGNILLNGKLNEIDPRTDIVLSSGYGIQTIRGRIELMENVTIKHNLDVNGLVNGVNVGNMCTRVYRPVDRRSLVINGNVRIVAPAKFNIINGITYHDLRFKTIRHDLKHQVVTGKKMIETLVLNGPVYLNKYINNLKLEYIFQNYMSLTMDQIVESKIILQGKQAFNGDILVRDNFFIENGIIGGVNVAQIDQYALRIYGDQQYDGNINFTAGLDIELHLNSKWINGHVTESIMSKRRKLNRFSEDIVFTRNLNVKENAKIVNKRLISGIDVGKMFKDAVMRNGKHNYTIQGKKHFDEVDVQVIHTRPLNKVTFSRENLLLKNYDQVITGKKYFDNQLTINTSIVVNSINDIQINQLNNRLVKKSKPNVIKTKVRIRNLDVNVVRVNALIDNVNISILNTISDSVNMIQNLERKAINTKTQFDKFERQLNLIPAKLLFYENFLTVTGDDLNMTSKPLLVRLIGNYLYLFVPIESSTGGCNQVAVFTRTVLANQKWNRTFTLYSPGKVISFNQVGNEYNFILVSHLSNIKPDLILHCISQNVHKSSIKLDFKGTVLVQRFRLNAQSLIQDDCASFKTNFSDINSVSIFLHNFMLISSNRELVFIAGNHLRQFTFDGRITMVYNFDDTILIETYNSLLGQYVLNIFRYKSNEFYKFSEIIMLNPSNVLMIDSDPVRSNYRRYLLIAETKNKYKPIVHVYATLNGTFYNKVQEIDEKLVQNMQIFNIKSKVYDPYIFMSKSNEIVIYRLMGMSGFVLYGQIKTSDSIKSMFVVHNNDKHLLALFYNNYCKEDIIGRNYDGSWFMEILKPIYQNEIVYGSQVKVRHSTFDDRINDKIVNSSQ